jgi:NADP-dependent 3-hydroxy acid dehydrogenase YdfG
MVLTENVEGKAALVTGASSGIGEATASSPTAARRSSSRRT